MKLIVWSKLSIKKLVFLHNLIQYIFFSHFFPILLFSPCHHPWQMMLFALQLLLQAKSNQWVAGPASHFEKCQVRTCLNPHIICATVGGLSLRLIFLQWLWWDFRAWTKVWGGSEKHLRVVGKIYSWLRGTIVPPSPSMWLFPGASGAGKVPAPQCAPAGLHLAVTQGRTITL